MERYVELIARWVLRRQFHISEPLFWLSLVSGMLGVVLLSGYLRTAGLILAGLSVVGIARWQWHRRRARGGLAVPYLRASAGAQGRAEEMQRDVEAALIDNLPPQQARLVHRVPVTVGPEDRAFAERLRRRLRAEFLLYGKIADRSGGAWSVYPRVIAPPSMGREAVHMDPHTRDIAPVSARRWRDRMLRLPPTEGVTDAEYPHAFVNELEAVLRATVGQVHLERWNPRDPQELLQRIEGHLWAAIAVAPESTSQQMDLVRIDLAQTVIAQGRGKEGMQILADRAHAPSASSDVLRAYQQTIAEASRDLERAGEAVPPDWRSDGVKALEQALEQEDDPHLWDLTLYNLTQMLAGDPVRESEAFQRLDDLQTDHYRKRWYVRRAFGVRAYLESEEARRRGELNTAAQAGAVAAQEYARAIHGRWRLIRPQRVPWFPYVLIFTRDRSPILHANLVDAHNRANHRWRALRQERIFQRLRVKFRKRGFKALEREDYEAAFSWFEWCRVGRHDLDEAYACIWTIVTLRLMERKRDALVEWRRVREKHPLAYIARADLWNVNPLVQSAGVPGSEPKGTYWALREIERRGIPGSGL